VGKTIAGSSPVSSVEVIMVPFDELKVGDVIGRGKPDAAIVNIILEKTPEHIITLYFAEIGGEIKESAVDGYPKEIYEHEGHPFKNYSRLPLAKWSHDLLRTVFRKKTRLPL
jgi:hypothetical protein